ncbi:MAG: sulfotransferase [Phycisphaeraceae bacterium]|nr:sulfotransferase [Phycisphaeraceae bacterium]
MSSRRVILCGGLQSSGSSLISWCFLQRRDTDGVFDANGDMVFRPTGTTAPYLWYKTTISGFSLCEQIACAEDENFQVLPLLVVRDVRVLWASLAGKPYGRNGTTAEDPPLRIRMRRFLADWQTFRANNWTMLRYESFVNDPELTLRNVCEHLGIPWDEGMLRWPKHADDISNTVHGNATFNETREDDLLATLRPESVSTIKGSIPRHDLAWLEKTFSGFNQAHDYPEHLNVPDGGIARAVPSFDVTRRFRWRLHQKPVRLLMHRLGLQKTMREPGQPKR